MPVAGLEMRRCSGRVWQGYVSPRSSGRVCQGYVSPRSSGRVWQAMGRRASTCGSMLAAGGPGPAADCSDRAPWPHGMGPLTSPLPIESLDATPGARFHSGVAGLAILAERADLDLRRVVGLDAV